MMKKAREFDNILDECLERVLIKGETVEQCLAQYPEHAAELEPLLRTALETKEAVAIKPRPEFRERASYQFQAALREMESKKSQGFLQLAAAVGDGGDCGYCPAAGGQWHRGGGEQQPA